MVNWYYVVGSERVGPVSESALKVMFMNNQITQDTYVWKKGFQNWERLKDVSELNFEDIIVEEIVADEIEFKAMPGPAPKAAPKKEVVKESSSPEIQFSFDWHNINEQEELFFIKIGKDRKNSDSPDMYGPYSLVEMREALDQKRVNMQTLVFAAGMSSWTKLQETILNPNSKLMSSGGISLNEAPLMLVFDYSPLPLITLVKKAGTKEGILLGAGPFTTFQEGTHRASLYVGNELKVKNVMVKIQSYDKIGQSMDCQFVDLNQDAKKIMLNHAV